MKIFDSNFWIAYFDKNDSQHKKAAAIFEREPAFLVTEYCILETASILARKSGKTNAELFLDNVFENNAITILYSHQNFFAGTVESFRKSKNKNLSFVDISLLYLSQEHEVITFDKDLEKSIKKHAKAHRM
jgi:predicted nucleic acid-binding protein